MYCVNDCNQAQTVGLYLCPTTDIWFSSTRQTSGLFLIECVCLCVCIATLMGTSACMHATLWELIPLWRRIKVPSLKYRYAPCGFLWCPYEKHFQGKQKYIFGKIWTRKKSKWTGWGLTSLLAFNLTGRLEFVFKFMQVH